jgi:hypothetical protein
MAAIALAVMALTWEALNDWIALQVTLRSLAARRTGGTGVREA